MAGYLAFISRHSGAILAALGGLAVLGGILFFYGRRRWARYVEERETLYQPLLLMAIANEEGGKLGPPFDGERRLGDWTIVENALFNWSESLTGFSHKGFRRIFDLNGFGEYERGRLESLFPSVRAQAAHRLGKMIYFKAIPDLLPMLRDRSAEVRRRVSWSLAKMGQSDATGLFVTSSRPDIVVEDAGKSTGAITGRFLWEDGEPIVIGNKEETDYLIHREGGMHGDVRNMPITGYGGRELKGGAWQTYTKEYRLQNIPPTRPAVVKSVLKQGVGKYYVVLHRQRESITVRAGSLTQNVDFVFPRIKDPDDRASVVGKLIYSGVLKPGYSDGSTGGRVKAVVYLRGERSGFYSGYLSFWELDSYRLHEVPGGRYHIKATVAAYEYTGIVVIPDAQPHTLDLTLTLAARPG